ncbi:synergin gamma-like [Lineus longissimus]|uniref:synergin gamma-like n=1 Tax=Lineus longissimus TaxID=88925 RepID=UPI002B4CB56C
MNIIPGQGMQPMGVGQFGMTPQQQQQRMMFPGQQQMMTQQQMMMQQQQGMQQMPGGMRPQGQMMQTQVGMGMQPQMHGMHNQMVRQVGPSQQQRFQQPGFQGQQMPRQPGGFQHAGGIGSNTSPQYMAPPPYTPQMAQSYTMRSQGQTQRQSPPNKPSQQPAKTMEEALKQRNFQSTQRRLMELGRLGPKKVDADSMIEAIIGKKEAEKQKSKQSPIEPEKTSDPDDGFGDFIQGPTSEANNAQKDQETCEVRPGDQENRSTNSPGQSQEKKDIMSMMLECSDLKTKTKAKTFHKPTVKEILVTNTRSASFQQSQNAAKWQNATDAVADALSEMFTVEVKEPEPQPVPVPPENCQEQAGQQQLPPGQYPVPGQQPGQVYIDASGQPIYPQGQMPTSVAGQGHPVGQGGQHVPPPQGMPPSSAGSPGVPPHSAAGFSAPPYSIAGPGAPTHSAAGAIRPPHIAGGPSIPAHSAAGTIRPPGPGLAPVPGAQGNPPQNRQTPPMQLPPHIPPMFFNATVIPELYLHVLEATTQNGVIDTTLVYGLLLRSQLPKEILGHIWSLANRIMPGQLIKEELYVILAMIAMAQQKNDISTLEILKEFPQPPVPNLGQNAQSQPMQNQAPPTSQQPQSVLSQPNEALNLPADDQDEFADFHQASVSNSNSFGDFVSSPAHLKPSADQSSESSLTFPASAANKKEEVDNFEEFKSAKPSAPPTVKGKPFGHFLKHDHHNLKVHGQKVQDLHFDFDSCKGSESSSLSSYKLDSLSHGSDSSKTSASFADNDDFDDFRSAESSENSSFGSYGGYQQSVVSNSTLKEQEIIGQEDKYAAFQVMKTEIPEPAHGKYSMFRTEDIGNDGRPINIGEAIVFKDLDKDGSGVEAAETIPTVAEKSEQKDEWANFQGAFSSQTDESLTSGLGAMTIKGATVDSFGNFTQAPPAAQMSEDSDRYSAFRDLGASTNTTEGLFTSSQGENKDKTESNVIDDDDEDNNFGDFSSFSSAPPAMPPTLPNTGTTTSEFNVVKPKPIKPTKNIFLPQPKTVGFVELSYGAMPDEPPDWDDGDDHEDDEDFAEFTGVSSLHSQDWIGDTDNVPGKSRFQTSHFKPRTLDTTRKIDIGGEADVHSPPSLTSPVSDSKQDDLAKSQSLTSLDSLSSNKVQFKEDTQSVGSFDFSGTIKMKELKDPAAVGTDSHSISSAGSGDSVEKKSNPDQQSVRSLEFKQGSEVEVNGDGFGEFSSSMPSNKSVNGVGDSQPWSSVSNGVDTSTWTQAPRDASELLTDGSAVLGDRYSSATHEIQHVEKHAYEWERCLDSCLEMISNANDVFNSLSRSVCNEVIKSEQGAEYVASVIEIYRVVCRITLSIKVSAVTNSKLLKLLKDIDLSWNNLTAFISTNAAMPDSSASFDYRSCVLKSDESDAQQKACGICLLNVDGQSRSSSKEEVNKFMYGGRQYHATCANYWVNCVDSMLPSLRLPELL